MLNKFINSKLKHIVSILLIVIFVSFIYQPGYLDYARRDHIWYVIERNQFPSDSSWFLHVLNYNRTRLNNPGDYLLFRPAFYLLLGLQDLTFRDNLLVTGLLSIIIHLFVAILIYVVFITCFNSKLAFPFALFFATQYAGIEMILWRHVSFYMLSVILSLLALCIFLSKINYKYIIGSITLFLSFMFHEIIPISILLFSPILLFLTYSPFISQDNKNLIKSVNLSLFLISILYIIFNMTNWFIIKPKSMLGPVDSFTINSNVLLKYLSNFIKHLGAGTRSFFDPLSVNFTWDKSVYDYAHLSWDITLDNPMSHMIWALIGIIIITTGFLLTIRRMYINKLDPSSFITLWASCGLFMFVALFSFVRLTMRDVNYTAMSSYYWWFFSFFYIIIIKFLVDELILQCEDFNLKKLRYTIIFIILIIMVMLQSKTARETIDKNYDLKFAKQIQMFISSGKEYFNATPNSCLDTNIISVSKKELQVYTMPFYLYKYNCGWIPSRKELTHPIRHINGETSFHPGPYPK